MRQNTYARTLLIRKRAESRAAGRRQDQPAGIRSLVSPSHVTAHGVSPSTGSMAMIKGEG